MSGPSQAAAAFRVSRPAAAARSASSANGASSTAANSAPVSRLTVAAPASPDLPLGLLLSASQPSSTNTLAAADYADMRRELLSGNLANAQQAYLRLQSDLLAGSSAALVNGGSQLNVAA